MFESITLVLIAGVTLTTSAVVVGYTYVTYLRDDPWREVILQEKLHAYREISAALTEFNRIGLKMGPQTFANEAECLVFDDETSKLYDPYHDMAQVFKSKFYIIDDNVRHHLDDYMNYLNTYQEDGSDLKFLFKKSGQIVELMRKDIGLDELYDY